MNQSNVDNPFVTVEYNDGQRFHLPITDTAVGQSIVFDKPTYSTGDVVPLGLLVKADTIGNNDYSALNENGGATGNGQFDQDDQFKVNVSTGKDVTDNSATVVQGGVVPVGVSVTALQVVPTLA
jgi:hypothetical protein